jgi:L-malate glycosyltransferase
MNLSSQEHRLSAAEDACLHIGVAGPCAPRLFASDLGLSQNEVPRGMGGTPVNHLVRAFLDLGHRVTLATLDASGSQGRPLRFDGAMLTLFVGPYRPQHRARDRFAVERAAITRAFEFDRPDAISAHWSYEFALGAIDSSVPTLVTVRDVPREIFRHQPSPYRLIRWLLHREALRRASGVAFNSPYTREHVGATRWSDAPILPNALPDASWSLADRPPPDPARPRFISVNNGFGKLKNVTTLLEAFSTVRATVPDATLTLVGAGYECDGPAAHWAQSKSVADGVCFLGALESRQVFGAVREADVLVHPSLEESFGYTLIEAASVGTPVIAGERSGAVPWVLRDGAQGVLVDVTAPQSLATAMRTLVEDQQLWSRQRTAAFELGRQRFSVTAVARQYVNILQGLVTHASSSRPR